MLIDTIAYAPLTISRLDKASNQPLDIRWSALSRFYRVYLRQQYAHYRCNRWSTNDARYFINGTIDRFSSGG